MAKRHSSLPLIIVILIIASFIISWRGLWIVPGPEGPEVVVYGINPFADSCSKAECVLTVGSSWQYYSVRGDTHNVLFRYDNPQDAIVYRNNLGIVVYAIPLSGEAQINVQPIGGPTERRNITVEYVDEDGRKIKKVFWLEAYDFVVEVSTKPAKFLNVYDNNAHYGVGPAYDYAVDVWLMVGSVDLAPPQGAWRHRAKPIAVYCLDYKDVMTGLEQRSDGTDASNNWPSWYEIANAITIQPEAGGRKLDLWTEPYGGKASDYFSNIGSTYKEALDNLPETAYFVLSASRISTAYKTEVWYDLWSGYHWYVNYVFPVDVIELRVWFIREADYIIPEDGLPPTWTTETPSFGEEESSWRGITWDVNLFGLRVPVWIILLAVLGIILIVLAMGGTKVVVRGK